MKQTRQGKNIQKYQTGKCQIQQLCLWKTLLLFTNICLTSDMGCRPSDGTQPKLSIGNLARSVSTAHTPGTPP